MGMGDFAFSLQMRDTIRRMMKEAIDTDRPRYRYAIVNTIDRVARKCTVTFNGETNPVIVNMGAIQPKAVGQTVRVEGIGTDKYISDVIGDPWFDPANIPAAPAPPTPYTTPDTGWLAVTIDPAFTVTAGDCQYKVRDSVCYFTVIAQGAMTPAGKKIASFTGAAKPTRNHFWTTTYSGVTTEIKLLANGDLTVGFASNANGLVLTGNFPTT